MPSEPLVKRAVAFVDGQNLFYAAKEAFGHRFPSYDPLALTRAVCALRGWHCSQTCFYTGVPDQLENPRWNHFWLAKLAAMGTRNVVTFTRPLRYRNRAVALPGGGMTNLLVGQEKGIDVRIALDIVRLAREQVYDVALIFSQDQDLSEVVEEIHAISRDQNRWIKLVSAFPYSAASRNHRGVNGTDWIRIDRAMYDACLDRNDYLPKPAK